MTNNSRLIGDLKLSRVLEMIMPFERKKFFPDNTDEDWAPHRSWLEPDALDPATDSLMLPMQSYVVQTPDHTILIDTCVGNHKQRPTRPQWHLKNDGTYLAALQANGIDPAQVDYVMCTHLHSDHVGWNTRLDNGRWVPTFPNAKYIFSEKELSSWRDSGHEKFSRDPYDDSVSPVVEAGLSQLVADDHVLNDFVRLEPTPGHTLGHVAVVLESAGAQAVMSGDLMHCPVQCVHPEWHPWPDWDPQMAAKTRRSFLERYADTDTLVCTAHFPLPSAGKIISQGEAFRFVYDTQKW